MNAREQIHQIRQLIAKDNLPKAINILQSILEHSPQLNEVLLQSARHTDITRQIRQGIVNAEQATVTQNKIRYGLLELLDEIDQQTTSNPVLKKELDQAISISNSKNVVVGSTISAGGNVQIGDNTTITESKISRNLRLLLFALVPALVLGGAYFWYQYQVMQQPLQLKVLIKNTTPNSELPEPKGILTLTYNGKPDTKTEISSAALFEAIPANNRTNTLKLSYTAKGFVPIDTSFAYQSAIELPVKRNADLAQIKGKIDDEAGKPLAGVKVSIDCCPAVYTDESGEFRLTIPFKHQLEEQRITLFKTGYEEKSMTDPVIVGEAPKYFLKKL